MPAQTREMKEKENKTHEAVEVLSTASTNKMPPMGASEEGILESFGISSTPGRIVGDPAVRRRPLPEIKANEMAETDQIQRQIDVVQLTMERAHGGPQPLEYEASGMLDEEDGKVSPCSGDGVPMVHDPQEMWQPGTAQVLPVNPSPIQLALATAGNKTQVAKHMAKSKTKK